MLIQNIKLFLYGKNIVDIGQEYICQQEYKSQPENSYR